MNLEKYEQALSKLTKAEYEVIVNKGTERPFSGLYTDNKQDGTYLCKVCKTPLFTSNAKFDSGSGWPSFDDMIEKNVATHLDADGRREEIVCGTCGAHLGHVFHGERFTAKQTRHCVNSLSLDFKAVKADLSYAYFAGGCFWGVEYFFAKTDGVKSAISGFMGGHTKNPTYEAVIYTNTGHYEVVQVAYDEKKVTYEELAKLFFEIHDPTQENGQGPDIGERYKSVVFVSNTKEEEIVKSLIDTLSSRGLKVATTIKPASEFYAADEYHQSYYAKKGSKPYCHSRVKRF
jgi:peptide methionine sulfoxide reductase msrA/msrB